MHALEDKSDVSAKRMTQLASDEPSAIQPNHLAAAELGS